jgi:hypothetical protein
MTQCIRSDQFGRPACLAAFAVSMGSFSRPSPDQFGRPEPDQFGRPLTRGARARRRRSLCRLICRCAWMSPWSSRMVAPGLGCTLPEEAPGQPRGSWVPE